MISEDQKGCEQCARRTWYRISSPQIFFRSDGLGRKGTQRASTLQGMSAKNQQHPAGVNEKLGTGPYELAWNSLGIRPLAESSEIPEQDIPFFIVHYSLFTE